LTDIHQNREGYFVVSADGEPSEYYATKKECRQAVENGSAWSEQFALAAQPATLPKRATFTSTRAVQRVLLTGLDCLPGQEDLFAT
jgi:hypothetical protein